MKVLVLSNNDGPGGAGRAYERLCRALHGARTSSGDLELHFWVRRKVSENPAIKRIPGRVQSMPSAFWSLGAKALSRLTATNKWGPQSLPVVPTGLGRLIEEQDFDLINLHWVGTDLISLREISHLDTPIIWTLHDMWPILGSFHYPPSLGYLNSKGGNRKLPFLFRLLERLIKRYKAKNWNASHFGISPSPWLAEKAAQSSIGSNWAVRTIPNPLDTNFWHPVDREDARRELGLPVDKFVLGFGSQSGVTDPRKGFELAREAVQKFAARLSNSELDNVLLASFGNEGPATSSLDVTTYHFGRLDDFTLRQFYSAVDLFMMTSLMDNAPQTATEAMSCGCPTLGIAGTGFETLVDNDEARFVVQPTSDALAETLFMLWASRDSLKKVSPHARSYAVENWGLDTVANSYIQLFKNTLSSITRE